MTQNPHNACPFCDIISGSRTADVLYRSDLVVAFLDQRPVFKGHALVVPSSHWETLGELGDDDLCAVMRLVRFLARADETALGAHGSFVAVNNRVSQSVPHVHVHVVPRHQKDGLRGFFWPRVSYESEYERHDYAERLRAGLDHELRVDSSRNLGDEG